MALRPLSQSVPAVTAQVCQRKYVMLGRLLTHWPEIVGEELAAKTQPTKLRYRKKRPGQTEKSTAILEIAATPSDSTLLHYRKDLILERINQIFGESWVADIRFIAASGRHGPSPRRMKAGIPSPAQTETLREMLEKIDDPAIYERLEKLGTAILQEKSP